MDKNISLTKIVYFSEELSKINELFYNEFIFVSDILNAIEFCLIKYNANIDYNKETVKQSIKNGEVFYHFSYYNYNDSLKVKIENLQKIKNVLISTKDSFKLRCGLESYNGINFFDKNDPVNSLEIFKTNFLTDKKETCFINQFKESMKNINTIANMIDENEINFYYKLLIVVNERIALNHNLFKIDKKIFNYTRLSFKMTEDITQSYNGNDIYKAISYNLKLFKEKLKNMPELQLSEIHSKYSIFVYDINNCKAYFNLEDLKSFKNAV